MTLRPCRREPLSSSPVVASATEHRLLHQLMGLPSHAGAPVKAIELSGERPDRGFRYRPVANGNCVFNRKGGK